MNISLVEGPPVLSLALRAMHQDMSRLDRIAMNLSNSLTPGYKRDVLVAHPFERMVSSLENAGSAVASANGGSVEILTDGRVGSLKSTGQSLDVALSGPGYFEVKGESGPVYTRQGNFHVDARGRLVTAQGNPVMGKGGEIFVNSPTPVIDAKGNVFDGQQFGKAVGLADNPRPLGQLKVVHFEDPRSIRRLGDGFVVGDAQPLPVKDEDVQIRQAYLENSNVNPTLEMVQLVQTMRHFETMQKIAQGYDEMTAAAIRKLGELS